MSRHNGTWEAVGVTFGLAIVAVGLVWFSYARGTVDQEFKDDAWLNKSIQEFWQAGSGEGRKQQRTLDLDVCQQHSLHPRLEDHCVAPL